MNVDTLLLNDEYNLLNKTIHSLNYYNNSLHDAGVLTNDEDHLPNTLRCSMNVADNSTNRRDHSSSN